MKVSLTLCAALISTTVMANDHYDTLVGIDQSKTKIYEVKVTKQGNVHRTVVKRGSQEELNQLLVKGKGGKEGIDPDKLPDRKLPTKPGKNPVKPGTTTTTSSGGGKNIIATTRELIALGKEIYEIVEAGRPVVNVQSDALSILPRDEKGAAVDSFSLYGWSDPVARTYKVSTKNGFGSSPVEFDFMLLYTFGGRLDGRGYYITGAQINAKNLSVGWGYDLNVVVKNSSIINIGTAENPVASGIVTIEYTIKTILKETRNSISFLISGIGKTKVY